MFEATGWILEEPHTKEKQINTDEQVLIATVFPPEAEEDIKAAENAN